jgi:hypothetical protein
MDPEEAGTMKTPACDCIRKSLNQFSQVDEICTLTTVYFTAPDSSKGNEEREVHLKSNCCPQCGTRYKIENP